MAKRRKIRKIKKKKNMKKRIQKRNKRVLHKKPKKQISVKKYSVAAPKNSDLEPVHRTKVRVIGIGGGGASIVSEIASRVKKADFIITNTDARSLKNSARNVKKFQFGANITHGLGTGMNIELGEAAAEGDKEKIKKLFEGQDFCVIISCLGGGAGSGGTPIFAKIAKSLGCLTYGIFTLPFDFEGEKKMEIAKNALEKIKPHLNNYSVIPNEKIFQIIDKNTPLNTALSYINKKLADNLEGLIEMIYLPGLINIDFADLRTILQGWGRLAYLETVEIEGPDREEALKKVVSSPLYPYGIKGARGILYNIIGDKNIQLFEVSHISKIISELINKNARIIFGINQTQKELKKMKITLLATGCASKIFKEQNIINIVGLPKIRKPVESKESNISDKESQIKKTAPDGQQKKGGKPFRNAPPASNASRSDAGWPSDAGREKNKKAIIKPVPNKKIISVKKSKKNKPAADKPIMASGSLKLFGREIYSDRTVRRTGLELKKAAEAEEKELLEKEKIWETPAILRRKEEESI